MKSTKIIFILMISLIFSLREACPRNRSDYDKGIIPVVLNTGMITEAEFPANIANVTKNVSSDSLQVETLGNRMFLLARKTFDSQIYVITDDNISYCLHLIMDETQAPTRIKITKPKETKKDAEDKGTINTVELMKTLINGGAFQNVASLKLNSREIFNNRDLRITAEEIYELSNGIKAFVLTFENLTYKPIVVPIEHMEFPGLLAISIESQTLEARPYDANKKSSSYATRAYMIVEELNQ
ncbi:MAG: hypothetical protein WC315_07175 [Candidatus Omnitrophota bacterium]|jgi:hypothetical protein